MRMKRSGALVVTLATAVWAMASCGGGGDSTTPPTHGSLAGKVIDTDSANGGVGGATLQITSATDAAQTVTTTAGGIFTVSNLDPGAYTIQLNTPANRLLATGESGQRAVTVAASNKPTAVADFKLVRPKGSVAGSVLDGTNGVAGATLTLSRTGFTPKPITADATGNFTLAQVPTGSWTLAVSVPAGLQLAAGESGTRSVAISADQTTQTSAFALTTRIGPSTVDVSIIGQSFNPQNLTISAGTIVRWTNESGATHTITPQTVGQAGGFARKEFSNDGVVLEHTFSVPGQVYHYRCEFHSTNFTSGMVGTITVQ